MPRYLAKGLRGAITTIEAKIQMHRGYVKVWRKLEDSGILKDERACQFFLWAMLKATHRPHKQIVGNQVVELEPGQFISGRNAASEELAVSPSMFVRNVEKLKKLDFLDTKPNNKFTLFTIKNWATYQNERTTSEQQVGQQADNKRTTSGQQADTNKNIKNTKNEKKEDGYTPEFEEAWKTYPRKDGKRNAFVAWQKAIKRDMPVDKMVLHIESRMYEPDWRKEDGKYVPHMATWLNRDGWLDEGAALTPVSTEEDDERWNVTSFYEGYEEFAPPKPKGRLL